MTSFETLHAETVALRNQVVDQLSSAVTHDDVDRMLDPLCKKMEALRESAPADVKEKVNQDVEVLCGLRRRVKTVILMKRLDSIVQDMSDKKEFFAADRIQDLKALVQALDAFHDCCNDEEREHVRVARDAVAALEKNPLLLLHARMMIHVDLVERHDDVNKYLALLKADLRDIDACGHDVVQENKRDVERARTMVKEIEELPDDQRSNLFVYREILAMRRCAAAIEQQGDNLLAVMVILSQLYACFGALDEFGNKTPAQEEEIRNTKLKFQSYLF